MGDPKKCGCLSMSELPISRNNLPSGISKIRIWPEAKRAAQIKDEDESNDKDDEDGKEEEEEEEEEDTDDENDGNDGTSS